MGQTLASCCNCFRYSYSDPNNTDKWNTTLFNDKKIELDENDVKKPLVVVEDDESWKKWSSYNLIHAPAAQQKDETYRPPAYISQRVSAEATWDL
jgi:hypothetical protein